MFNQNKKPYNKVKTDFDMDKIDMATIMHNYERYRQHSRFSVRFMPMSPVPNDADKQKMEESIKNYQNNFK